MFSSGPRVSLPLRTGVVLYYCVNGVEYYKRIVAKEAEIDKPPTDQFWSEQTLHMSVT